MIKQLILSVAVALTVVGSSHAFVERYSDIEQYCRNLFFDDFKEQQSCIVFGLGHVSHKFEHTVELLINRFF